VSARDIVFFVALMATAIALGGALAHAFELPNKINMPGNEYFIVQKAYRGWNQLAYVLLVELLSIILLIGLYRHEPFVRWFAILALVCLVCAQVLFWVYTYPANVATQNWTVMPENWALLRSQWEYSHLGGALFQLGAMAALIAAALGRPARPKS
jgi:multisubunit Na+/H+ antiporter MnhB subunit